MQQPHARTDRGWKQHTGAILIALLFFVLANTYSLITPLFETPDETYHTPVIHHIATTGRLPVQEPDVETLWNQEGSQPPLYYLIGAGLTFWIDTSDLEDMRWLNPHSKIGLPDDPDNKNLVIHTDAEQFPWRGTVLMMRVVRFFSVLLSTGTVVLVYFLSSAVWPRQRMIPLLAMALSAFNPQFLFISGALTNDNLSIFLSTWTLLLVVQLVRDGITTRRITTLAIVAALGTLTKISGLTLMPVVGLALLIHAMKTSEWRRAILAGLGVVAAWLVLAGWWYARNVILYGELLGTQTMVAIAGPRDSISLARLRREWYGFWTGYWAQFGWVSIIVEGWIYKIFAALTWAGIAGLVVWAGWRIKQRAWADLLIPGLLILQIGVTFAGLIRWTLMTYGSLGRLMFPVSGAISALLAFGLLWWLPEHWQKAAAGLIAAPMLVFAAAAPFVYIAPAYAPPPTVTTVPAGVEITGTTYEGLEIVALTPPEALQTSGRRAEVTLYLRAEEALGEDFSLFIALFDADWQEIGRIDTYPGGGALPSSRMVPGVIYEDHYAIRLTEDAALEDIHAVAAGVALWEPPVYTQLTGTNPDGSPSTAVILPVEEQ